MKKILSPLLIAATLFAADTEPIDTNTTASTAIEEHSEHGPLFTAVLIVSVPIVIIGGIVYYAVLTPIALTYWALGVESSTKKVQ